MGAYHCRGDSYYKLMTNQKIAVYRTKLTECKLGNKFYNIHQAELKIWMRLLLSDGCSN